MAPTTRPPYPRIGAAMAASPGVSSSISAPQPASRTCGERRRQGARRGDRAAGELSSSAGVTPAARYASSTLPNAVACSGSSVPTSSVWKVSSGRKTWWTTSTWPSRTVPIRTASPLRAASGSAQLIERDRSSLMSR